MNVFRCFIVSLALTISGTTFAQDIDRQALSHDLGVLLGAGSHRQLQPFGELDLEELLKGFRKGYGQDQQAIGAAQASVRAAQQKLQAAQQAEQAQRGEKALAAGKAYLDENGKRDGVTTTASGLQYETLQAGTGKKPSASSKVTVHYRGTLIDGTEFDSSYNRGQPTSFPLNGVIPGWTEGLQLMQEGAKFRFVIPSQLAYGPRGGGSIGPNETLIFEVELISVDE